MQQTEKYKFNLPNDFEDRFSTDPMNENMKKVERELAALAGADAAIRADMGTHGKTARITYGTYEGKGTYGVDNPNSLTFDFKPLLVAVLGGTNSALVMVHGASSAYVPYYSLSNTLKWADTESGGTVSWYISHASGASYAINGQFNNDGVTYRYVAIGCSV